MSCFFPSIFKKNTYKKVRFFILSALIVLFVLLFSGCRVIKSVASAPFKAVGWGATKVSEVIEGGEPTTTVKKPSDGHISAVTNSSGPNVNGREDIINFDPLVIWAIILIGIALIVRFLFNKYVARYPKE